MDLDTARLPAHIHAATLTAPGAAPGDPAEAVIVWADRTYRTCPGCGLPVARDPGCPAQLVTVNPLTEGVPAGPQTFTVMPVSQRHQCGTDLPVIWHQLPGEIAARPANAFRRAAAQTGEEWAQAANEQRSAARAKLITDLGVALSTVSAPLEDGETQAMRDGTVTTGSPTEPGIYYTGDFWTAWDFDPASDADGAVIAVDGAAVVAYWKEQGRKTGT